jgi:hypothetical protein
MHYANQYSRYIDFILRWMEASDIPVNTLDLTLSPGVLGRCFNSVDDGYVGIGINVPQAREALLTLAHEVGHWLGNETFGHKKHSYQRERQAVVFGWRALGVVGAQHLFTRAEWMDFHKEDVPDGKPGDEA